MKGGDRYNFHDKLFKDREFGDKDNTINSRRGEDWNNGRARRPFPQSIPERKPRRNGEPWEGRDGYRDRDSRDFNNGQERGPRDKEGRFGLRKNGTKFEGSWFRDGNSLEGVDAEEERSVRNKDWRRDRQGGTDRDWNRGSKMEPEPEWLESNDKDDDSRRARTQEDFERWKEKMKAGSGQPRAAEKKDVDGAAATPKPELRPTDGNLFSDQSTPFQADATMDSFFGLLKDSKSTQEKNSPVLVEAAASTVASTTATVPVTTAAKKEAPSVSGKSGKASRFAGLFSPQAEKSPADEPASIAAAVDERSSPAAQPVTKDADQEGFQRILQMLGGGGGGAAGGSKSRTVTPKGNYWQQPRPPSAVQTEPSHPPMPTASPVIEPLNRQDFNVQQQRSPARGSPVAQGPPLKGEREHLLRLMQQVQIAPPQPQPQSNEQRQPPNGLSNMPEILPRTPGIPAVPHKPTNFFGDPAIANMARPEGQRLPNPVGYMDDMPFPHDSSMAPPESRVPPGLGPSPVGMQQPPGFEHVPRPLFMTGCQPFAPPPGIAVPTTRGMNLNFPPNMMPIQGSQMNERQQQHPPPFMSGGPPPGLLPPPGHMNVPPGFPPMQHVSEPMMGPGHGPYGTVNPSGPPPSSRHLLDMLGQTRDGLVGPGHFR